MLFLTLAGITFLCLLIPALWPVALVCAACLLYFNAYIASVMLISMAVLGLFIHYATRR